MRILQLSTFDTRYGAAIAARRLHEALLAGDQECDFLVRDKEGSFPADLFRLRGAGEDHDQDAATD